MDIQIPVEHLDKGVAMGVLQPTSWSAQWAGLPGIKSP